MLIKYEKIIDSELLGESFSEELVHPYEEQSVENTSGSLWRRCISIFWEENAPLFNVL